MSTKINLESGDVYLKPQFYSKDEVIANELKTYNNYLLKWLRFDMGKKHYEIIQPTDIKEWLVIGDDASVSVDKDKMSSWVEDFCLKYKTVGKTRSFKSHTGEILQVSVGITDGKLIIVKQLIKFTMLLQLKAKKRMSLLI